MPIRVSYPLVGALLIQIGAVVGSLDGDSPASTWTFALGLAVLILVAHAVVSQREVDRLRASGLSVVATIIAGMGTMSAAEVGGDLRGQFSSLLLVVVGTLVILAALSDRGMESTPRV